jgi:GDPmannose 4,6-dehydratase
MLQNDVPDTFVLATGRTESVRDFVEMTCKALDIEIFWKGNGLDEIGVNKKTGDTIIKINSKFHRPAEVDLLLGNPTKAKKDLGWEATTTLEELCAMMVEADLRRVKDGISF